jgi:hypothetical protein
MITWPIYVALILAFFSVRKVIKMEEKAEKENMEDHNINSEIHDSTKE